MYENLQKSVAERKNTESADGEDFRIKRIKQAVSVWKRCRLFFCKYRKLSDEYSDMGGRLYGNEEMTMHYHALKKLKQKLKSKAVDELLISSRRRTAN